MSICPICAKQDSPIEYSHIIYTAICEGSTVRLTRKITETRTRTSDYQKHNLMVCDQCERKWKVVIPAIMWSIIAVIALAISYFVQPIYIGPMPMGLLGSIMIALIIGFSLNKLMWSLNVELKEAAKEERKKTTLVLSPSLMLDNDPRYANAKKDVSIVAFTEAEYQRMLKQNK